MAVEAHFQLQILWQVALAMLLAAVVGLEREFAHKPAGLRTHMLLAGASALLVGLAFTIVRQYAATSDFPMLKVDPTVVIQAVVTATGFLGAGTILRRQDSPEHVEGLTTAASLLFVAGIGVCTALGQTWLAVGVTILAFGTLHAVRWIEGKIAKR
jgi:putative Mg2+ transporter-C (MgtC) family protein